jgi:hypothetical protein
VAPLTDTEIARRQAEADRLAGLSEDDAGARWLAEYERRGTPLVPPPGRWESQPVTVPQRKLMRRLGLPITARTRGEASRMIQAAQAKRKR